MNSRFFSTEECVEQPSVISDGHSDKNIMFNFSEIEKPSIGLTGNLLNEMPKNFTMTPVTESVQDK